MKKLIIVFCVRDEIKVWYVIVTDLTAEIDQIVP